MTAVTSEARIPVALNQEVDDVMLTNMGLFAQGSIDNLVANCIGPGLGYTGCACRIVTDVQANTATLVSVDRGWMKRGGKAYALRDPANVDLAPEIAKVPAGKTAVVLIYADGQEAEVDAQVTVLNAALEPADPNAYWPTTQIQGPTAVVRSLIPGRLGGVPDPQPDAPALNPGFVLLATAVVDNGSIVSLKQETAQQIVPTDQLVATVLSLSAYVETLKGVISGLLSSVAANALAITLLRAQEQADVASLQRQIDQLRITATTPAASTFTGQDLFLDLSQSKPDAAGYNALVSGGLRFAVSTKADVPVAPANSYSGNLAQGTGNYLYPSGNFHNTDYFAVGDPVLNSFNFNTYAGNLIKVGNLGALSTPVYRRGFARARIRASISLKATSQAQVLANGDPSQLFAIDPATFVYDTANWGDWKTSTTEILRQNGFWSDLAARDYWSPIVATGDTGVGGGLPIASQPVTPAASFMSKYIKVPTSGYLGANVRLMMVADKNGQPDFTRCYADVTAQSGYAGSGGSPVPGPTGANDFRDTLFEFPCPVLFKGGVTYHLVQTADQPGLNFWGSAAGPTAGGVIGSGSYLAYFDGAWAAPRAGARIGMIIYRADFDDTSITVDLAPLQLAGGGDTADFQFSILLPEGCTVTPQIKVGGQWVSLSQALSSTYPLAGNPSNVPARLVITGTDYVAPVIDLSASTARFSKASAALEHVSAVQTPAAPVTTVHKSLVVDNWNPAVQTLNANLRTGAGYATVTAPTAVKDIVQTDGSLLRTWTWTLGAAVPSFEMEIDGSTTDATQTFVGRRSNWDAAA